MIIKVSDYIAKFLVEHGITYDFTVPGGGAMHLNMSFGHQEGMNCIFMQHEQAAAIAAEGFFRLSNKLPVVCCTTGPGGTNTLTGVLGAWLDSIPMLIVSGQVKYSMSVRSTALPLRSYGDQEYDIVKAVSSMTKYSTMVINPMLIKYHLKKAIFLATSGRPGPVWLDIPQNVQSAMIDTDKLIDYNEQEDVNTLPRNVSEKVLDDIICKIQESERPVLYTGLEIRNTGSYEAFCKLANKLNIPIVTSFEGIDLVSERNPLYVGRAGDLATRYGNWAVQNSDFLLVLGNRLSVRQVSYATETWARDAFVVQVYPDVLEFCRPSIHVEMPIYADIKQFSEALCERITEPFEKKTNWFETCSKWRSEYPVVSEEHYKQAKYANVYCLMNELSKLIPPETNIVSGNGSACVVGAIALQIKEKQRYIMNSTCATMGYDLPASIGACFSNGKKEICCITGDGSIQMNLQELQTIVFHNLPIKIVLINNRGYHQMRLTERGLFKNITPVGIGPESDDLSFPNMEKIAVAYGIPYISVKSNNEMEDGLKSLFEMDGYALCEVFVDTQQAFEPKPTAMKRPDGSLFSPPLEDLAPFLTKEELERVMIIPMVDRDFN